jgi:ferredoxin-NADP reductase
MKTTQRQQYKVVQKHQETSNVTTLVLEPSTNFSFVPGQYITVFFSDSGTPEGKSYSISSAPHESNFTITIKAMGEFSNRLCELEPGDFIEASLPYGFFFSESDDNDIVLLASGIGIAPFRSMIVNSLKTKPHRKIIVHYSIKTVAGTIYNKEFKNIQNKYKNLKMHYYFTQEGSPRMEPREIIEKLPTLKSPEFFICGSIAFVRDMWNGLKKNGVPEDSIFTEAFF